MKPTHSIAILVLVFFACSSDEEDSMTQQEDIEVTSIAIDQSSITLSLGSTTQINATVIPANATNKSVVWSSTNESVATVSNTGLVSAEGAGNASITVTTVDGGFEASVSITVNDPNEITHNSQTWKLFNGSAYTIKVNNGNTLQLDLAQNVLWYNSSQGGLIYKNITGDFTLTANVHTVKKSNNSQPVTCFECFGGIMVRNPSMANGENYVLVVTGETAAGLGVEVKSTTNNVSVYYPNTNGDFPPYTDGYTLHDLRIVRSGNSFELYKKSQDDANFVLLTTYNRPDMPASVMVGVNIYTPAGSGAAVSDLSVIYQDIVITQ